MKLVAFHFSIWLASIFACIFFVHAQDDPAFGKLCEADSGDCPETDSLKGGMNRMRMRTRTRTRTRTGTRTAVQPCLPTKSAIEACSSNPADIRFVKPWPWAAPTFVLEGSHTP